MVYICIYTKITLKLKRAADNVANFAIDGIDGNITIDLVVLLFSLIYIVIFFIIQ